MRLIVGIVAAFASAQVLVGAVEEGFFMAEPAWAKGRAEEKNLTLAFSRNFMWRKTDGAVKLKLAGATVYRVFLNGEFVHWGPERTVYGTAKVDTVPLTPCEGENALVIEVGGYNCASFQYSGDASFLTAELSVGGKVLAATPAGFEAVESPRVKEGPVYSRQRGFIAEGYTIGRDYADYIGGRAGRATRAPTDGTLGDRPLPRLTLARQVTPRYMQRASAVPAFKVVKFKDGTLPAIDSGFIGLKFRCAKPGKIAVEFDEALVDGKIDLNRNGDPLKSWHAMLNRIEWTVKDAGEYTVETIEPYTMKYLKVVTDGGEFSAVEPYLRECRNPGAERVKFNSTDEELNRLFEAARNSIAQNAVDIFTDCPSRERVGWLCDTYFTAEAAAYMTGDFTTEQEYLLNFVRTGDYGAKIPPKAIPGFMPSRNGGLMPTYMMWYVLQCARAADRLARLERRDFSGAVKPRIESVLDYLAGFEKEGVLADLPGWVFIEWSKANNYVKGVNYPANMLYAAALEKAGELYGRKDWISKSAKVRAKVLAGSFRDGCFHDQSISDAKTEIAQYYAFFTGLATPTSHPELWRKLVDEFGPDREIPAGFDKADAFIGWMLRLEVLRKFGENAELFRSMKLYYGKMAEESGTLWEFADGHDSRCHAFGSNIAALMLKAVFGINRIDWAHRRVVLGTPAAGIAGAEAEIPLARGATIAVKVENGRRVLTLPPGWTKTEPSDAQWIAGGYVVPYAKSTVSH